MHIIIIEKFNSNFAKKIIVLKQLLALFLLPYLIQTTQRKRRLNEKGFRPTKTEAYDNFIPHFKVIKKIYLHISFHMYVVEANNN